VSGEIGRRSLLIAGGAVVAAAAIGTAVYETMPGRFYTPKGYADLLSGLGDRADVVRVGNAVLREAETFDTHQIARQLRQHIAGRPLATVLGQDAAEGRTVETAGWVLPETLALLCGLEAKLG
jgi:hypothetical protein